MGIDLEQFVKLTLMYSVVIVLNATGDYGADLHDQVLVTCYFFLLRNRVFLKLFKINMKSDQIN